MKTISSLLFFGIWFVSLSCNHTDRFHGKRSTIPLEIGTSWTLVSTAYSLSLRVDSVLEIGKKKYARIEEISKQMGSVGSVRRITYLREDENGNIERLSPRKLSLEPHVDALVSTWYKYDVQVGDSWTATANSYFNGRDISEYQITLLSTSDTIVTPAMTYPNCYRFFVDDKYESDSEYYDWISPGTGLVKRSFSSDTTRPFLLSTFTSSL